MRNRIITEDLNAIIHQKLPWKKLKGKTVLISGANGFLPAYMVETLLFLNEKGYQIKVIALVRNKKKALQRFAHYAGRNELKFAVQDVCQPIKLNEDIHFIIHAASQASPKFYGTDPVGTLLANTLGTYQLLECAREKKVESFLFFSSGEVYGQVNEKLIPTKENDYGYLDPTAVRSCYAEGKRMGETMCVSWFHQYGVPAKIIRPFHTYGPCMDLEDGRVFADFVADMINQKNIVIKSDGHATRAFCYLADAVSGFFTVLFNGKNGEAYNIGGDQEISILKLAETLVKLFPEKKLKVIQKKNYKQKDYIPSIIDRAHPDITKIKALKWHPQYSIQEGFKRTILSY